MGDGEGDTEGLAEGGEAAGGEELVEGEGEGDEVVGDGAPGGFTGEGEEGLAEELFVEADVLADEFGVGQGWGEGVEGVGEGEGGGGEGLPVFGGESGEGVGFGGGEARSGCWGITKQWTRWRTVMSGDTRMAATSISS